jgi:hypothetical protein
MSYKMNKYKYIPIVLVLLCAVIQGTVHGQDNSGKEREYKIKAAFLYNFIKFVDWPEEKIKNANDAMVIGIIGKDPFGNAFEPVKDKNVKGQKAIIKYFKSYEAFSQNQTELKEISEELTKCNLLFISSSEINYLDKIINIIKNSNVLTVGENKDFLKAEGIINFLLEENKVRFEINLVAAKKSKLQIRSQLLRLAKNVIEK